MQSNILICGVGGQGIVLTSKLIAATAMEHDIPVMSAETIGMAQKGGSVFGFEPAEAVRMLPYVKDGGQVVVNEHPIMPVTATLSGSDYMGSEMLGYLKRNVKNLIIVNGTEACEKIGSPKVLNMIMLGASVRNDVLPFSVDDIEDTMKKTVKPQFIEMNSKALRYV